MNRSQIRGFYFVILILSATLLAGCCKGCGGAKTSTANTATPGKKVVFLQINDVYKLRPIMPENVGGLARLKTMVDMEKSKNPGALFVLAGDFLSPSIVFRETQGKSMIDMLNLIGLDAASIGNHEFDYKDKSAVSNRKLEALKNRIAESNSSWPHFTWINSNILENKKPLKGTEEFILREVNGTKVGVFALVSLEAFDNAKPDGADIEDNIAAAKRMISKLKGMGAAMVVALTHQSWSEDRKLARETSGLTLILGGHDHEKQFEFVNGVAISKCGSNAKTLCVLETSLQKGKPDVSIRELPVDKHFDEFGAAKREADLYYNNAMASYYSDHPNDPIKSWDDKVGHAGQYLIGTDSFIRNQETNLGDFIADSIRTITNARAVIVNSGSIRLDRDLYGEIKYEDILELDYFSNFVVTFDVSGKVLKDAIKHGAGFAGQGSGKFPQISGMRVKAHHENGKVEVDSITIEDPPYGSGKYTAVDDTATYTLTTICYIAQGNDGYGMFKSIYADSSDDCIDTKNREPLKDIILAAIALNTISPKTDGRMSIN